MPVVVSEPRWQKSGAQERIPHHSDFGGRCEGLHLLILFVYCPCFFMVFFFNDACVFSAVKCMQNTTIGIDILGHLLAAEVRPCQSLLSWASLVATMFLSICGKRMTCNPFYCTIYCTEWGNLEGFAAGGSQFLTSPTIGDVFCWIIFCQYLCDTRIRAPFVPTWPVIRTGLGDAAELWWVCLTPCHH